MKNKSERLFNEAQNEALDYITRRHFLQQCGMGFGGMALGSLLGGCFSDKKSPLSINDNALFIDPVNPLMPRMPHFAGRAKSVIYIHAAGAAIAD